jgi:hypothetical protein
VSGKQGEKVQRDRGSDRCLENRVRRYRGTEEVTGVLINKSRKFIVSLKPFSTRSSQ